MLISSGASKIKNEKATWVFNKISKLYEIKELHPLFGEYDLISKIQAEEYESIAENIILKIKTKEE